MVRPAGFGARAGVLHPAGGVHDCEHPPQREGHFCGPVAQPKLPTSQTQRDCQQDQD